MDSTRRKVFKGTEMKFILSIESVGFNMVDDEFSVELSTMRKKIVIPKSDMILDEQDRFIFTFDTAELGTGDVTMKTIAYVPDEDFKDGFRTEVDQIKICKIE